MTTKEIAAKLHISPAYLRELLIKHNYQVQCHTPGGHRRFSVEDIAAIRKLVTGTVEQDTMRFARKTREQLLIDLDLTSRELDLVCDDLFGNKEHGEVFFEPQFNRIEAVIDSWREHRPLDPKSFVKLWLHLNSRRRANYPEDIARLSWLIRGLSDEDKSFVLAEAKQEILKRRGWVQSFGKTASARIERAINYFRTQIEDGNFSYNSAHWLKGHGSKTTMPSKRVIRKVATRQTRQAIACYHQALAIMPTEPSPENLRPIADLFRVASNCIPSEPIPRTLLHEVNSVIAHLRNIQVLSELIEKLSSPSR